MIIDEIIALLLGDDAFNAVISNNVFDSALPRSSPLPSPAVTCHIVTGRPSYISAGTSGQHDTIVQFDITGDQTAVRGVRDALATLLENYRGELSQGSQVQATFWEMDMDEPLEHALAASAVSFHVICQVRFIWVD